MDSLGKLPDRIRLGLASYQMQAHRRGMSQAEYGEAVAQAEGRAIPYDADTVNSWMTGGGFPSFDAICAIGAMYLHGPHAEAHLAGLLYGDDALSYGVNETDYRRYIGDVAPPPPKPPIGFR